MRWLACGIHDFSRMAFARCCAPGEPTVPPALNEDNELNEGNKSGDLKL